MWKLLFVPFVFLNCVYDVTSNDIMEENETESCCENCETREVCTDPNATNGCGINCGKKCSKVFYPNQTEFCPRICRVGGCDCKEGFYFDSTQNKCVKPQDCTPPSCPANSMFELCPATCPPRTCATRNIQVKCIAPPVYPDPKCPPPGCRCKDGFYKNTNGDCVTKKQCEQCSDPNAKTGCGVNCGRQCANVFSPNQTVFCSDICNVGGCDCNDGFYFDHTKNKCVKPQDCTPPQCPKNEEFNLCPSKCPPRTCDTKDAIYHCPLMPQYPSPKCQAPACQCKDGFFRNRDGACVTKKQCEQCPDPNARPGCGVNCGRQCSNVFSPNETVFCTQVCYAGGCDCIDGFYFDPKQKKCVKPQDCTPPSCPANQVFELCPSACPPRTCATRNIQVRCITPPVYPDSKCRPPGCRCKDGFYKNTNGDCVTKKQCEQCSDPNAKPGCGVNCGRQCVNVFSPNETFSCIDVCYDNGCDCNDGFYFDPQQKKCVKPQDCTPPQCPNNEEFQLCPTNCPPRTCATKDAQYKCIAPPQYPDSKCLPPACKCKEGFYRNTDGDCVTKEQCDSTVC